MKYAELHYFADPRFVSDGYSLFLWSTEDSQPFVPNLPDSYGIALMFNDGDEFPGLYSRYNPTNGQWADPLTPDSIAPTQSEPGLAPFWSAIWDNEAGAWAIASIPPIG